MLRLAEGTLGQPLQLRLHAAIKREGQRQPFDKLADRILLGHADGAMQLAVRREALRVVYRSPSHGIAVAALHILAHAVSQHLLGVIKDEVAHNPRTCLARMLCWISLEPPAMV